MNTIFSIAHTTLFWVLLGSISLLILIMLVFIGSLIRLRRKNERIKRKRDALEAIWHPYILEIIAGNRKPEVLWGMITNEDAVHFLDVLLRYYRRFRGRERREIINLAKPLVPQVAAELDNEVPEDRAKVVQLLGVFGLQDHTEQLIQALNDVSLLVAMNAARALARSKQPEFGKHILAALPRFDIFSTNVRAALLSECGEDIIPLLRKAFATSEHPLVRRAAGEALLELADPMAVLMASHFLQSETDADVLIASLEILEAHGRREDTAKIHPLLFWTDESVRIHAAKAMVSLATPADRSILREIFDDPDAWISLHASRGLHEIGAGNVLKSVAESDHPRASFALQYLGGDSD